MAKDSNEPTPKLPDTAELLRKLEQRWADLSSGLKYSPDLEQIAAGYNRWLANFPTLVATPTSSSRMMRDELAQLRELMAEKTPPAASKQPQVNRVLQAIPECFPNGDIDGIPDPDVRQKVGDHLQPETKKGLKVPDRKTMNCAIRQYRNRTR
jgi:hypothetical protein